MNILIIAFNDSGRYTAMAAAKSVAGLRIPEFSTAHNRALSGFFMRAALVHLSMVAQAGAPSGAPVSVEAGNANSVWATTNHGFASVGGSNNYSAEAANMATIPAIAQPEIAVINGQAITTSLAIAEYFSKQHKNVIQKIQLLDCSSEFAELNFKPSEYTDATGRKLPCYQITRDGFAFLAMGFTGKRAAQFKEAYITAFNQMERAITRTVDTSSVAQNAHVAYLYMAEIRRVWMAQLYPMLKAAESPLAVSLYDYINDGVFAAGLVDRSLNGGNREVRK